MYFSYMFGSTCTSSMVSVPVSQNRIVPYIYDFMNVPDMSHVAMSLFYLASMIQDSNMDYVVTVGELASSFIFWTL